MKVQFRCVKIRRFDGEKPKLNTAGGVLTDAKGVPQMEPASLFTIEMVQVDGSGKLEFNRVATAMGFVEGKTYSIEIAV